jgi:Dolichyl-phosphate-mannose-protein mannosyltransferase
MVANTTVPSRDCVKFVRDALHLEHPPKNRTDWIDVVKKAEHPPAYPAAILAMSKLVRKAAHPTVEEMALSAQLVSAIAGVLLVVPFYFLSRRVFDRNTATAAVAVFMVLPVGVEVTSDGISDGLFLLTAVSAMWFAVRALERERPITALGYGLGTGLCCGLGFLVRPDSLIIIAGIGLTFAGLTLNRLRRREISRPALLAGIGLTVGAALLIAPYVKLINKLTNKPAGNELIDSMNGGDSKPTYFERGSSRPVRTLFASWWNPQSDADQSRALWAVKSLADEYLKGAHYAVPVFALVGLYFFRRRLSEPRIALLVVVAAVQFAALWILAWKIGYVSQRHTLLSVLITCIFAGVGFGEIGKVAVHWWKCGTPWQWGAIWAVLLIAAALPRDFRSLHEDRAGHKAAGKWIAEQNQPDIEVVDPFGWAEWYAGRSLTRDPSWFPQTYDGREKYAIFEPNAKSPHSRLQYYDTARILVVDKKAEIVFRYPPGVPDDQIKVAVYLYSPAKR